MLLEYHERLAHAHWAFSGHLEGAVKTLEWMGKPGPESRSEVPRVTQQGGTQA